jgi:hypothetical protein
MTPSAPTRRVALTTGLMASTRELPLSTETPAEA